MFNQKKSKRMKKEEISKVYVNLNEGKNGRLYLSFKILNLNLVPVGMGFLNYDKKTKKFISSVEAIDIKFDYGSRTIEFLNEKFEGTKTPFGYVYVLNGVSNEELEMLRSLFDEIKELRQEQEGQEGQEGQESQSQEENQQEEQEEEQEEVESEEEEEEINEDVMYEIIRQAELSAARQGGAPF